MIDISVQEDYLKNRLDDQINWYDKKSSQCQKMYKKLQLVSIIGAASIPLFSGYLSAETPYLKYLVGVLGLLVAVLAAVNNLYKYQENWITYRATCEGLKHEKYLYTTATSPYSIDGSFNLLVQRVEMIMSEENSGWLEIAKKTAEKIE